MEGTNLVVIHSCATRLTPLQKSEPSFDICIKAPTDEDFAVTLGVVLVATYPKSPPLLTVKQDAGLGESIRFKIQKFTETQPRVFARDEQAMIDRIVEGIRDILEEAAQKKAKGLELPSLEEERAAHEAKLAKLAQDEKVEQERQKLEESKESERVLGDMLQQEIKRQRTKAQESRKKTRNRQLSSHQSNDNDVDAGELAFDQPCKLTDASGNASYFQAVVGKTLFSEGPVTTVYKVQPVLPAKKLRPVLALKEVEVKPQGKDMATVQFKKQLKSLETQLEALKKLNHHGLLQVLDFKIDRGVSETDSSSPAVWTIRVLIPFSAKGSLEELLEDSGSTDDGKAKLWTSDLLDALAFLHSNGIVHQDLHPGNIILCREDGKTVPMIADASYQREFHNFSTKISTLPSARAARSAYWFPPEIAGTSKPQYTQKTDIWDFGVVFIQMLFGLSVLQKYQSPTDLVESLSLSSPLEDLVLKFFKSDSKKRPRAFELGSSEFLATNAPVLVKDESAIGGPLLSVPQTLPVRLRQDSMNLTTEGKPSRYQEDFVEEGRLGKGGFGEVVKARKRIDNRYYAVKKIPVRSSGSLSEVVNEVRLLSQMNHPAVVRYYNTWIENDEGASDTGDEESTTTEDSKGTLHAGNVLFANDSDGASENESKPAGTRGLDYMSSSGHPMFGSDDEDEDDEGGDESDSSEEGSESDDDASTSVGDKDNRLEVPGRRRGGRAGARLVRKTIFVSMEYCEKRVSLIPNRSDYMG